MFRVSIPATARARSFPLRPSATALGLLWLVAAAFAYLAPAWSRGIHLGSYDLLTQFGLTSQPGVRPYNTVASDQITQFIPWSQLAWNQVHAGRLPLWNPYNAMGLPLAFDFQSAVFSVPMLVGYLGPSSLIYTISIVIKLIIAGTGTFLACRVLGTGVLAATFAGTVFELSGAFTGWLGWPQAGVFCWIGWILGAALLLFRPGRRWRRSLLLSVVVACAVYGGHPESLGISMVTVLTVVAVTAVIKSVQARRLVELLPFANILAAAGAGLALAAPLLLPGLQLVPKSVRYGISGLGVLPKSNVVNFAFAGFFGFPTSHSNFFGASNYYESAAYVGIVVLLLAATGAILAWRKAEVISICIVTLWFLAITFLVSGARFANSLPFSGQVVWTRSLVAVDFALAILAAFGIQAILDSGHRRPTQLVFAGSSILGVVGLVFAGIRSARAPLPQIDRVIRNHAFVWPGISMAVVLLVVVALFTLGHISAGRSPSPSNLAGPKTRRLLCLALFGIESVFLLTGATGLWASTSAGYPSTPAVATFEKLVGHARVAFSSCPALNQVPSLGLLPEANSAYGVSELPTYDPILPRAVVTSWAKAAAIQPTATFGTFCPSVDSASLARTFGVSFIVAPGSAPAPEGTRFVKRLADETLYRVPGASVVSMTTGGSAPEMEMPVSAKVNEGGVAFSVHPSQTATLHIRVTDVPGWRASDNGEPLTLHRWEGSMLQATVRAGRSEITLRYRPKAFERGVGVALLVVVSYGVGLTIALRRQKPKRPLLGRYRELSH